MSGVWHEKRVPLQRAALVGPPWCAQTIELAPAATRGHRSAASLATGPVMAEPAGERAESSVDCKAALIEGGRALHTAACRALSRKMCVGCSSAYELRLLGPMSSSRGAGRGRRLQAWRCAWVGRPRTLHLALRVDDDAGVVCARRGSRVSRGASLAALRAAAEASRRLSAPNPNPNRAHPQSR